MDPPSIEGTWIFGQGDEAFDVIIKQDGCEVTLEAEDSIQTGEWVYGRNGWVVHLKNSDENIFGQLGLDDNNELSYEIKWTWFSP